MEPLKDQKGLGLMIKSWAKGSMVSLINEADKQCQRNEENEIPCQPLIIDCLEEKNFNTTQQKPLQESKKISKSSQTSLGSDCKSESPKHQLWHECKKSLPSLCDHPSAFQLASFPLGNSTPSLRLFRSASLGSSNINSTFQDKLLQSTSKKVPPEMNNPAILSGAIPIVHDAVPHSILSQREIEISKEKKILEKLDSEGVAAKFSSNMDESLEGGSLNTLNRQSLKLDDKKNQSELPYIGISEQGNQSIGSNLSSKSSSKADLYQSREYGLSEVEAALSMIQHGMMSAYGPSSESEKMHSWTESNTTYPFTPQQTSSTPFCFDNFFLKSPFSFPCLDSLLFVKKEKLSKTPSKSFSQPISPTQTLSTSNLTQATSVRKDLKERDLTPLPHSYTPYSLNSQNQVTENSTVSTKSTNLPTPISIENIGDTGQTLQISQTPSPYSSAALLLSAKVFTSPINALKKDHKKTVIISPSTASNMTVDIEDTEYDAKSSSMSNNNTSTTSKRNRNKLHSKRKIELELELRKKYACKYQGCERTFTTSGHLSRHYRCIHAKEKPFECPVCKNRCSRSDNLKQHMLTHFKGPNGEAKIQEILLKMAPSQSQSKSKPIRCHRAGSKGKEITKTKSKQPPLQKDVQVGKSSISNALGNQVLSMGPEAKETQEIVQNTKNISEERRFPEGNAMGVSGFAKRDRSSSCSSNNGSAVVNLEANSRKRRANESLVSKQEEIKSENDYESIHAQVSYLVSRTKRGRPRKQDVLSLSDTSAFNSTDNSRLSSPFEVSLPAESQLCHRFIHPKQRRKRLQRKSSRNLQPELGYLSENNIVEEEFSERNNHKIESSESENDHAHRKGNDHDDEDKAQDLLKLAYVVSAWG